MTSYEQVKAVIEEQAQKAFDLGWNTAVITISESIARMTALGDTAASFAVFVKEFQRDMAFPTTPTATPEEQQPTEVQPEQP
jgi:hypothetical protein